MTVEEIEKLNVERKKWIAKEQRERMTGENNPRWKGGSAEYPNHSEFKRARINVLKREKGKCEICGDAAKLVHHIDENKGNHIEENLAALCYSCHSALHFIDIGKSNGRGEGTRPTSKYHNIYGIGINKIAEIFGVTVNAVYYWVNNPQKKEWLEAQLRNKKII
jgi:hypothetical protein